MSEPCFRIKYEATLDEMVETSVLSQRLVKATQRGKQFLRRYFVFALPLLATVVFGVGMRDFSWNKLAMLAVLALVTVGLPGYLLSEPFYDWCVRRNTVKVVREKWGAEGVLCETEFLEDKIWVRQNSLELGFPWRSLIEIEDGTNAVLLWFDMGLVRFPNRIFEVDRERDSFLKIARELSERTSDRSSSHHSPDE